MVTVFLNVQVHESSPVPMIASHVVGKAPKGVPEGRCRILDMIVQNNGYMHQRLLSSCTTLFSLI